MCLSLLVILGTLAPATRVLAADLAVVIDDVGYSQSRGLRAIELPGPITIAMLPFAPHTQSLARYATLVGKDLIVHQPMEPHASGHAREETGTLKLNMDAASFAEVTQRALEAVPGRIGVSNHTGSLLTAHRAPMAQFMNLLNRQGLFFLDSRTTAATVALDVANEQGVPALKRDVFLDHDRSPEAVHRAFERAIYLARKQGHAVLIGHPYAVSLDYLEERLTTLPEDIRLVTAASLARQSAQISRPTVLAQPPHPNFPHISPGR